MWHLENSSFIGIPFCGLSLCLPRMGLFESVDLAEWLPLMSFPLLLVHSSNIWASLPTTLAESKVLNLATLFAGAQAL